MDEGLVAEVDASEVGDALRPHPVNPIIPNAMSILTATRCGVTIRECLLRLSRHLIHFLE
jgi:hypothetical protein